MEANSIFVENSPYEMIHLQMSSQHRKKALKFFFSCFNRHGELISSKKKKRAPTKDDMLISLFSLILKSLLCYCVQRSIDALEIVPGTYLLCVMSRRPQARFQQVRGVSM